MADDWVSILASSWPIIFAALVLIGGVAGVVTALRPWIERRHKRRDEDRVGIFEPMSREMTDITDQGKWRTANGMSVWTRSAAFSDLLKRRALNPPRLRVLRRDVSRLLELDDVHEKARTRFYDVVHDETGKILNRAEMFNHAAAEAKLSQDEFESSATALISQADFILKRLDAALAGKLVYKAR
jgi:hypothetical protein